MKFKSIVDFTNCLFISTPLFNATFHESVTYDHSVLKGSLSLGCKFDELHFYNCLFSKAESEFNQYFGKVQFIECKFNDSMRFAFEDFGSAKEITFARSILPHRLMFQDITMGPEIDLTKAALANGERIEISFKNCDVSRFKLDYEHFKLHFDTAVVDEMEASYESLLNNFKNRGQQESYRLLDIEYHDFKYRSHWYNAPLAWINWAWWNYGYAKGLVFFWTVVFLLIFTPITFLKLNYLNKEVYKMKNIPDEAHIKRTIDKWWYSFIYTSSIFFKITIKLEDLSFTNKRWTAYIFIVYILGVLCLAYMANFVLQK